MSAQDVPADTGEMWDGEGVIPCYIVVGNERVADISDWLAARDAAQRAEGAREALAIVRDHADRTQDFVKEKGLLAAAEDIAAIIARAGGAGGSDA